LGENDQAEIPSDSWGDAEGSGKLFANGFKAQAIKALVESCAIKFSTYFFVQKTINST